MKAYLLSQNPDNWTWPDFDNVSNDTKNGKKRIEKWACSSKQVKVGDRIFLTRTGSDKKGIYAAGHCVKESFDAPHYNPDKAASGKTMSNIEVEFDWIQNPEKDDIISYETLINEITGQLWAPQTSGISINDDAWRKLELMWSNLIGVEHNVLNLLQSMEQIVPDTYDGSYELVRKTVECYSAIADLDTVTFDDLDLLYNMAIISTKKDAHLKRIEKSNLPRDKKDELIETLESVWNKAEAHEYQNVAKQPTSVGMFNSGFSSFDRAGTDAELPKKIIGALVEVASMEDDAEIYRTIKTNIGESHKGLGIASFSELAHCLKPNTFPIINGNQGYGTLFESLVKGMNKGKTIVDYIDNCEKIKVFRDSNVSFKNYRSFDLVARMIVAVDFSMLCNFLEKNAYKVYKKPNKCVDENESEEMRILYEEGFRALGAMKKVAGNICSAYGLDFEKKARWFNAATISTVRDYLWIRMYKEGYRSVSSSISLFVDKTYPGIVGRDKPRIRVSLEVTEKDAESVDMSQHHRFLDKPLPPTLCYIAENKDKNLHNVVLSERNPDVIKQKITDGTYQKIQLSKVIPYEPNLSNEYIYNEILGGVEELLPYYDYVIGEIDGIETKTADESTKRGIMMKSKIGLNTILYGPPGTGKTYNSKVYAVAICDDKTIEEVKKMDYIRDVLPRYNELVSEGRVAFTTFHQSYGYEEFIEGIKPLLNNNDIYYDVMPGVFKKFCEKSLSFFETVSGATGVFVDFDKKWQEFVNDVNDGGVTYGLIRPTSVNKDKELYVRSSVNINIPRGGGLPLTKNNARKFFNGEKFEHDDMDSIKEVYDYFASKYLGGVSAVMDEDKKQEIKLKPCVFIIDEINRGNISKIFGELITLIEESKRDGADEAMSCALPYSGEPFSVPGNVYILGTMNTADRSIALMDTALRRRFDFIEMLPASSVVKVDVAGVDISALLDAMNSRIAVLLDREHTIGHSFFTKLNSSSTVDDLAYIFKNKIIPLLQEYFYEDYSKIRLVLGDNNKEEKYQFVKEIDNTKVDIFKGKYDHDVIERYRYEINEDALSEIESYKQIM